LLEPTWGRHKFLLFQCPGIMTVGGRRPYYDYFGAAPRRKGWTTTATNWATTGMRRSTATFPSLKGRRRVSG
jgi:hypothetical protein